MHWFGEKFGFKISLNYAFGFSGVAGCPEGTAAFRFYFRSVREIAEAAKVCDFFYLHPFFPPYCYFA
jgi:hypothetical protein